MYVCMSAHLKYNTAGLLHHAEQSGTCSLCEAVRANTRQFLAPKEVGRTTQPGLSHSTQCTYCM